MSDIPAAAWLQDGRPDIDLLGLVAADPEGLLATLDAEVAADVTAAAHLFAQRVLARWRVV